MQYVQYNGQESENNYPYTSSSGSTGFCDYNNDNLLLKPNIVTGYTSVSSNNS